MTLPGKEIKRYRRTHVWDYSRGASFFITIVTSPRRALFGRVSGDKVLLSALCDCSSFDIISLRCDCSLINGVLYVSFAGRFGSVGFCGFDDGLCYVPF